MNPHLQPWSVSAEDFPETGFASDRLEFLLRYAVLAPSNHNTQPWRFRINVDDIEVFADARRALPVVDPQHRELRLSCGAVLLNLRLAAGYFGHRSTIELQPDTHQPDLLARFILDPLRSDTPSEDVLLFHAITHRHTNRSAFRPDPIPDTVLTELADAATAEGSWFGLAVEENAKYAVADLVAQADKAQWGNRHFRKELATWVRTHSEDHTDGMPTREVGIRDWMSFAGPALIRTFSRGNGQAAHDVDIAVHSPVLAVLGTDVDDARIWLKAGQAMERVLLTAEANGVAVSHLNQPIEIEDLRSRLATIVGHESGFPQLLLRLGYGPEVPHTPRRDLQSFLLRQDTSKTPPH